MIQTEYPKVSQLSSPAATVEYLSWVAQAEYISSTVLVSKPSNDRLRMIGNKKPAGNEDFQTMRLTMATTFLKKEFYSTPFLTPSGF